MGGLESGWVESNLSGTFHFMPREPNLDGESTGRCGFRTMKALVYFRKSEIPDASKICVKCEIAIRIVSENTTKNNNFIANMEPIKTGPKTHVLKAVICSELGCNNSGGAYVSTTNKEKEHFCILHNGRIPLKDRKRLARKMELVA